MSKVQINNAVRYIGCDDHDIDLFESQYVVPNGISYNSYLIIDEKIAIMDTVDARATNEWLANLERELSGRKPDYLVVSHMEPDHAANIKNVCDKYPDITVVGNSKTFVMIEQFFDFEAPYQKLVVKESDVLDLGKHKLSFIMAPMIHWPEVMMSYDSCDKILFSADAFGKFGALDAEEDWACEARRYYMNIVGKYGVSVQGVLKKASSLDIETICPLHGPILKDNLSFYIDKYNIWSSYRPEDEGVTIAYASIHGNTAAAAKKMGEILEQMNQKVSLFDLCRDDMAEAIEDAFRYDKLIIASPTYDGALFPAMEDFLYHLKIKAYQNRKIGIIENGSWAPLSGKLMRAYAEGFKGCTVAEPVITLKSKMNNDTAEQMKNLAIEMTKQ